MVGEDITQHVLHEQVRRAEQHFRLLAETIPQIVWTAEPNGDLDYYNQRWFDYTGMTLEQTKGWGWEPVLHPDDLQNCVHAWSEAVRTGNDYEIHYRFKRAADGRYRWHLGRARTVRNPAGEIVKWFGTCTDIDDQKRAEERSEEQYELLVRSVQGYAILTLDPGGRITTWNEGATGIKGYQPAEILGEHFSRFYPPEDVAAGKPAMELEVAERTGSYQEEGWRLRKDGSPFWANVHITALKGEDGVLRGFANVTRDDTAKRRAAETEERARALVHAATDAIVSADSNGNLRSWNPAATTIFGHVEDEMRGKPITVLMPERFHEGHRAGLVRFLASGEPHVIGKTVEVAGVRKDGTEFPLELALSAWKHGSDVFFTGIIRDITSRKRAEQLRSVQSEVTRLLADSASLGESIPGLLQVFCTLLGWKVGNFWAVDGSDHKLRVVSAWCAESVAHGALVKSSEGMTFERGVGYVGRVWASHQPEGIENVGEDPSFVRRHAADEDGLRSAWSFAVLAGDEVVGVMEFFNDKPLVAHDDLREVLRSLGSQIGQFVQRKRVEEERDQLVTLSADLMGVAGFDGYFQRVNPSWVKTLGWTAAELTGSPWLDFVHPQDIEKTIAAGAKLIGGESLTSFENRYRCKSGEYRWLDWRCVPLLAEGRIYVFARDVTLEKEAGEAHSKLQRRLVVADRMASVGTLAAGAVHEINNPLAYVMANLDLVLEEIRVLAGGSSSARMKDLEDMVLEAREGAERVRKIVRGLKTFSRAEEERRAVMDVKPALELAINMSFNEIRHRARLVKDYGATPFIEADDARLGQVFVNLLVNAAQAIPEGHAEDNEIRVVTSTDTQGRAVVEIRDTGPGIPEAERSRIFEPFFTTKSVGVGTGLGLSIYHNIVTGMGGEISVTVVEGRGTSFWVVFPAARVQQLPGAENAAATPASGRRATVLVVDDEPAVGMALSRILREHEVYVVTNVKDALAMLASGKRFDVIFSDLMMPQVTGIDFYHELARRSPEDARRIVFVSGGAFTPAANEFLAQVANERIAKPFTLKGVRDMVQRFLK